MTRPKERQRTAFVCQDCGYESAKWMGFCPAPACRAGQPLVETNVSRPDSPSSGWVAVQSEPVQELANLDPKGQERVQLPGQELNRVLGGGIVAGSVVLLAGEPGVGKSTLLLQIAQYMSSRGQPVLYVSGEESPHQIKLRSDRLGFPGQGVFILSETDLASGPGSVAQVRETGLRLIRWAKARHVPVFLAGHVTKDGSVAGPRVLEHMVDAVIYLESQEFGAFRILRSAKNRFGSTAEVGVFEMTGQGLVEVSDPSQVLLSQRQERAIGSALAPVLEGTRPLLLEIQALTSPSQLPAPRRVANGVDYNRMLMLATVASRRAGLELSGQDIIVSVAGGLSVREPAADLAVVLAIASSLHNKPLDSQMVAFGEVGLSGEIRPVPQAQRRVAEALRLGLDKWILPETGLENGEKSDGMHLAPVRTVRQAIQVALGSPRSRREVAEIQETG